MERILLALMGMAVDIDGVSDLDMRRMDGPWLILRGHGAGSDAPFLGRGLKLHLPWHTSRLGLLTSLI